MSKMSTHPESITLVNVTNVSLVSVSLDPRSTGSVAAEVATLSKLGTPLEVATLSKLGTPPVVAPLSKVDVPPEVTTESTVTVPPEVSVASTESVPLKETVESTESTPPEETESAPSQATESLPVVKVTTASSENMPPEETESAPLKVTTASSENIPLKPTTMSPVSVLPPELTQAQEDANQLHRAFKGWSCDAPTIVKILAHRNATQRDLIRKEYNTKFSEDLDNRLSKELSGDLKRAVLLWMHDPTTRDAVLVKQGLTENLTLKVAIEVICSRTPSQIEQLKKAYRPLFGSYLEQDIESHASGDNKELLLAYVSKLRPESPEVDATMVDRDAKALFKDGEYKLGTNEATFIRIFSERSWAHLAAVDAAYRSMYVNSLRKAVKHETSWNFKSALLTILQCAENPAKYFAKVLHKAMNRLGTDEKTLSRIIVSRAEIDIQQIKAEYLKKYRKSLSDEVHSETSGNYRAFLLSFLDTNN